MKLKTLKNNIQLLTEDIYSAPQSRRAIKYLMREGGYSKEQAKQVIDGLMHDLEIHHSKDPKFKFMLGLSRLFATGQLNDEQNISRMKTYLKYLSSEGHNDENKKNGYNEDINGENLQDLSRKFDSLISSDNEKSRDEVNSIDFGNSDYNIVRIDSERQCRKYGKYTSWCITHGSFKQYSLDSFNQCYFCLKPGFENVRRPENPTDAPFDEYGLSMISVIVDENGNPKYITTRYNHDYEGENNPELCTAKQVSQLIGVNFYETFKPNNKWKELVEDCKRRLQNGEKPEDVFDYCGDFSEGFAVVVLNDKYNFINTDGKIISEQWFDNCYDFHNGFAKVYLNNKGNFINTDGNILSKQWFDFCGDFHEGFAFVKLNGKNYKIDKNGKLTISEIKESYNRGENVLKRYDASNKQLYTRTKCVTMCNNHLRQDDFINVFFINRLIRDKKIYPKGSTIYKGKTVSLYNFWDILRIYSTVSQFNSKQNAEFFLKNCKNDYMYIPEKNVLLMKKRSMDEKAKEQFDKKEKEKQRYESAVNNRARYDSSELDDKNN
jgi:hypothetical protein